MKTILLAAGVVGLCSATAAAGNKTRVPQKPVTLVSIEKSATANVVGEVAIGSLLSASPELLDIPVLPADTSSALVPYPELERARPLIVAKPGKVGKSAKKMKMKLGADYVLGRRQAANPTQEFEHIIPKSLNQAQVATVVQSNLSDIQQCWNAVPAALRADACTADLRLSISDAGVVTDIELGGDVPAGAHKCITSAVARWTFPVAETRSEIEYGIALRSR